MRASVLNSSILTILIILMLQSNNGITATVTTMTTTRTNPHSRSNLHRHKVIEHPNTKIIKQNKRRIRRKLDSSTKTAAAAVVTEKDDNHDNIHQQQQQTPKRNLAYDLSEIFSLYGKVTDDTEDADADDYFNNLMLSEKEQQELLLNDSTNNNNNNTTSWMYLNQTTWSNIIPKSSLSHKTQWYELSHYVEPDSIAYDMIEGFLIAVLLCLIVATCYDFCYYYCLIRCGIVEDDRIYKSLLYRKGRKVRQLLLTRRRGRVRRIKKNTKKKNKKKKGCCSFSMFSTTRKSYEDGRDGGKKGLFAPLNAHGRGGDRYDDSSDDESLDSWNSDEYNSSSSLSQDSALSLEYGDKETFDEDYGEKNEHLTDTKLEDAAKSFFENQEKQEQMKKKAKVGIKLTEEQKRSGVRSIGSRRSRRSRRSRGTSVRSQASSILSSESGSLSSFNGSSSDEDDDHSLEMESAMMDLELAEKRMGGAC